MRFGVLNATSGILVAVFSTPDKALERVQNENQNDPDQIFTMVPL
ncbi:hypothetical protein [Lachnospira sp.]|jgi:hypothetical protein|nr:hypothetical protein [Lachnospira sp.]